MPSVPAPPCLTPAEVPSFPTRHFTDSSGEQEVTYFAIPSCGRSGATKLADTRGFSYSSKYVLKSKPHVEVWRCAKRPACQASVALDTTDSTARLQRDHRHDAGNENYDLVCRMNLRQSLGGAQYVGRASSGMAAESAISTSARQYLEAGSRHSSAAHARADVESGAKQYNLARLARREVNKATGPVPAKDDMWLSFSLLPPPSLSAS